MVFEPGLEAHHRRPRPEAAPTGTGGVRDEVRPVELPRAEAMRRVPPGSAGHGSSSLIASGPVSPCRSTNAGPTALFPVTYQNVETDALPWAP